MSAATLNGPLADLKAKINETTSTGVGIVEGNGTHTPGAGVLCKPGSVTCVETYVVDSQVFWRCGRWVGVCLAVGVRGGGAARGAT